MNRFAILLLSLTLLTACNLNRLHLKAGISFHDESSSKPEITDLPNPLGIIRGEYDTERGNTLFCEHISSLPNKEEGRGLNHCGFLMEL